LVVKLLGVKHKLEVQAHCTFNTKVMGSISRECANW